MKLKTWLLLSYLVVMILPLMAAYLLVVWIQSYHDDQKVAESINTMNELQMIKLIINDPKFFNVHADRDELEQLVSDRISITLYNPDGLIFYTSKPTSVHMGIGKESLYQGLYSLEQGYRTFRYKEPVFHDKEIIGFFEIEIARQSWVTGVSDRSVVVFGIFIVIFILIYLLVILFVHQKLNKRFTGLMEEMSAFASGQITEEKKLKQDEIGELQSRFYDMRKQIIEAQEKIEEQQREKEYMIATLSHDLKTPLTSIKAYAESLSEPGLSHDERKEYQQVIIEKSDFMKQMLDDLLMYTLLQSPTYDMELVSVEGCEFFDMLVSDYDALCEKKNIELLTHIQVDGTYLVNPQQLIRVMDNLMSNAIHHTPVGGQIGIAVISTEGPKPPWLYDFVQEDCEWHVDHQAYLMVQNSGAGISEENISRVFEPLYQADQARRKQEAHGTGLGLSITKQIISRHDGDIHLFSREGIGTCVICTIPKQRKDRMINEVTEK